MIKGEGNNLGKAKDMGAIGQNKEETKKENLEEQRKVRK